MYIYIYIHYNDTNNHNNADVDGRRRSGQLLHATLSVCPALRCMCWLRTSEVNANGAAAKVKNSDIFGKLVCPGTFGEDNSRLTGVPRKSLCQNT